MQFFFLKEECGGCTLNAAFIFSGIFDYSIKGLFWPNMNGAQSVFKICNSNI